MDEISVSTAEGFADIRFPIKSVSFDADGGTRIALEGDYKGNTISLELSVQGQMRPGLVGSEIDRSAFYPKGIVIRSQGDNGAVAEMFAKQYGVRPEQKPPMSAIELTCFALDGNPGAITTEHLNFKVFHDDENSLGLYFEMYIHIDLPGRYIRFDEKDEEYRTNVVSTFAANSAIASSRLS